MILSVFRKDKKCLLLNLLIADIVEKSKNVVEKFEYDTLEMIAFDIYIDIWKFNQ